MIKYTRTYWVPWETIIMQGGLDDNVLPSLQEKFAPSYRAAGGECQLEIFEGCEPL